MIKIGHVLKGLLFCSTLTMLSCEAKGKPSTVEEKKEVSTQEEKSYKTAFIVDVCMTSSPEAGEDIGFYLMHIEDTLIAKGIHIQRFEENYDLKKIPVRAADGSVVNTIDLSNDINKERCAGVVVIRNGVKHEFIPLDPINTQEKALEYFK